MAKVLVTGGAGFIGTHLCRALVNDGHDVRVLDLVGPKSVVEGVHYERGDVRNPSDLARMISGVDAVYHFAAVVSVPLCQEQPLLSYQTNLFATCGVLEAIRQENLKQEKKVRLIFAGSSVVYGNLGVEGKPLDEDSPTAIPMSFYGAQKLGSEHPIRLYHQNYGIPAVVFRFFNVYGPGQDPNSPYSGVISIFSSALREGRPMHLNGGGNQTRDFVSVYDVVRANVLALSVPEARCDGRAINLGTGQHITIRDLATRMIEACGKQAPLVDAPARIGDVLHSLANISRASEILSWKPAYSLRDGLSELLKMNRA